MTGPHASQDTQAGPGARPPGRQSDSPPKSEPPGAWRAAPPQSQGQDSQTPLTKITSQPSIQVRLDPEMREITTALWGGEFAAQLEVTLSAYVRRELAPCPRTDGYCGTARCARECGGDW